MIAGKLKEILSHIGDDVEILLEMETYLISACQSRSGMTTINVDGDRKKVLVLVPCHCGEPTTGTAENISLN